MKRYYISILILFIGITINAQSFKVIVNKSNPVSSGTKKEISDFFLKKKSQWSNGQKVVPIDQIANSDVRKKFTEEVHGKPVSAIKSFWQQAIFAGQGTPPIEMQNDEEIIKYVIQNAGAIGYVSAQADIAGVKEFKIAD